MKHLTTLLLAVLLPASLSAQTWCYEKGNAAELIRQDSLRTGNNHHHYEYTDLHDTKAPAGYKAFYISHYGRHGSRSDYQEEAWARVAGALRPAYELGLLTDKGNLMYETAMEMCEASDGMREMLTTVGVKEHAGIASRMYDRFPAVFKGAKVIDAKASTVQRCVLSMGSFTTALAAKNPKLQFDMLTGPKYMEYIARTEGYREATKGSSKMLDEYKKQLGRDVETFLGIIFKDPKAASAFIEDPYHFESDLISTANYCQCFGIEDVFHRCMPFDVYYNAWSLKNHSLYLLHCNSVEFGDRRIPIARPLVNDIIERADAAVAGNGRAADLRFGHDYPLLALGGYLDIEGVGGRYSFDEIDENWFGSYYICMASNLQIIFYRNKKNDVLVKCLWNERECAIPSLTPVSGPYYRWSEVRDFWATRYPEDKYPDIDAADEAAALGMPAQK